MRCPKCKEEDKLYARYALEIKTPILKGGGVKPKGFTAAEVREAWTSKPPPDTRIVCDECETVYSYIPGSGLTEKVMTASQFADAADGTLSAE